MAQEPSLIMEDLNHTYNHYKSNFETNQFSLFLQNFGQLVCLTKLNYFSLIVKTILTVQQITILHSNTPC